MKPSQRVLELGGHAAGYCGRLFVRAGADVVRIEQGDPPPAWASSEAMALYLQAGKRTVRTADPALIARLADQADVVICEAGTADELQQSGFASWQTPVKVAITPFGLTGPKRNWRATPSVLLAMGGYTMLIGDPGRAPLTLPGHYVEFQAGALGYAAAQALALAGQQDAVDISMLETVMSLSQFTTVRWHCAGEQRQRHGNDFWYVVPSELFRCADGWVYVNIVPSFWDAFVVFIERPDLLLDDRFSNNDLRMIHREPLHQIVAASLAGQTRQQLLERAEQCRIPLGAVLDFDEVLADPHLAAREYWETVRFGERSLRVPGLPFSYAGTMRPTLPSVAAAESSPPW